MSQHRFRTNSNSNFTRSSEKHSDSNKNFDTTTVNGGTSAQDTTVSTDTSATSTATTSLAMGLRQFGNGNNSNSGRGQGNDRNHGRNGDDRNGDDSNDRDENCRGMDNGGAATDDTVVGSNQSDRIAGGAGADTLVDSASSPTRGMNDSDKFRGGSGDDTIYTHFGSDRARGSDGNDVIVSRSDAGEPLVAQQAGAPTYYSGQPFSGKVSNDRLTGGTGADTFQFRIDINAKADILAKHMLAHSADEHGGPGVIDWEGVTGENGDIHLHWVDSIGTDTITDFSRDEGDKIEVYGHTAAIKSITMEDRDGDGQADDTVIELKSEQGAAGAHDEDNLGTIVVLNNQLTEADVTVHAEVHLGEFASIDDMPTDLLKNLGATTTASAGDDVLVGSNKSDSLDGGTGNDTLIDSDDRGNAKADMFSGGDGDDTFYSHWGSDKIDGGAGNDVLVSRSDAGEPIVGQAGGGKQYYSKQPFNAAVTNDTLTGGAGADTFQFRLDLNARADILAKHIEDHEGGDNHGGPGVIDWEGVTGENGGVHLHWVDSIGTDTITDFVQGEDKIELYGHTVAGEGHHHGRPRWRWPG